MEVLETNQLLHINIIHYQIRVLCNRTGFKNYEQQNFFKLDGLNTTMQIFLRLLFNIREFGSLWEQKNAHKREVVDTLILPTLAHLLCTVLQG